jgi:hypothetical protein
MPVFASMPDRAAAAPSNLRRAAPMAKKAAAGPDLRRRGAVPQAPVRAMPPIPEDVASELADVDGMSAAPPAGSGAAEHVLPLIAGEPRQPGYAPPLVELARTMLEHLRAGGSLATLDAACRALATHEVVRAALDEIVALTSNEPTAWALLAQWLEAQVGLAVSQALPDSARLRLARLDGNTAAQAARILDRQLGQLAAVTP